MGGGFPGIYDVTLRILSLAILAVVLVGWLVIAWRCPSWQPGSAIWPAFVVSLAALGLATVTSPNPRLGYDYVAYAVLLTAAYLLLVRLWAHPFFRARLGALTVAAAFGVCIAYLSIVAARWFDWWTVVGSITAPPLRPSFEGLTYGNPSAVLTVAILLVTSAVAYMGWAGRSRRFAMGLLISMAAAVVFITGSRAGWLAVGVAAGVSATAWSLTPDHRSMVRDRVSTRRTRAGLAIVLFGALGFAVVMGPAIVRRLGAGGEEVRTTFFATAIRMLESSPIVGIGPGGWAVGRIASTQAGEVDYYVPHAHDIYLQTAAESGIVGLAAGAVAIAYVLWLVLAATRDDGPVRRRFGWASLFSLIYFGTHQILDFYPNMPAAMFAFVLPIAWLDATSRRPARAWTWAAKPRVVTVARVGLLIGVMGAVAVLAWSERAAVSASAAARAANLSDWGAALSLSREAVRMDPDMPTYRFTLGLAAAATGDDSSAAEAFETAALADDLPEAWLDLAAVRTRSGDERGAKDALANAVRLGLQQPATAVAVAWLDLRLRDQESASEALGEALLLAPSLAGDPYWSTDPWFATIWPGTLARSIAEAPASVGWQLALVSGDGRGASAIAVALPDDDREFAQLVIDAWEGDRMAFAALEDRARDRPLDLTTVSWVARVSSRYAEPEVADRYRRWADGVVGHSGQTAEMRVVPARTTGDVIAGSNTAYHSQYVYRRDAPVDHLVPWLPRLTYR